MAHKRTPTESVLRTDKFREQIQRANSFALGRIAEVLSLWLPGGRQEGQEYVCANLGGGQGRSCKVNLATGRWADFATDDKGGDLVSLFAAIHGLRQSDAAQRIAEDLGITPDQTPYRPSCKADTQKGTPANAPGQIIMPVPSHAPSPPDIFRHHVAGSWVKRTVADRWAYRNEHGQLLGYVCRFNLPDGGKEVVPQVYSKANGKTSWQWKAFPVLRPLYGLDRLAASAIGTMVIVCEGEKTADAAQRLFPEATSITWPGGSKAVAKADFSPLAGRTVVIWPDADKCGYAAAMDVAEALEKAGTTLRIVAPPENVKSGWDLADAEAENWKPAQVAHFIEDNSMSASVFTRLAKDRYGLATRCINPNSRQYVVRIEAGKANIVDDCESILSRPDLPIEYRIFQRGSVLVRLANPPTTSQGKGTPREYQSLHIYTVEKSFLFDVLRRFGKFEKMNRKGEILASDPPKDVVDTIPTRAGLWPMPSLRGILTCPTLRPDGSLLLSHGYDLQSRYYLSYDLDINIPEHPTLEEARQATNYLMDLLSEFMFAEPVDRSVALALLLSAIVRPSLDHTPLFVITAPTRGSGKSTLVDITSILVTGQRAAVISATSDHNEREKRLTGCLLSGDPLINLDNCNGTLESDLLCQALTAETLKVRPLGISPQVNIPNTAFWCANGNNLTIAGDLLRRVLRCRLDTRCERPEERYFKFDPLTKALEYRSRYIGALLTILRAYIAAGRPNMGGKPFGGFGQWASLVRNTLIWVGEPDPCASRDAIMDDDPELAQLRALLPLWWQQFGKNTIKIKQLIERSKSNGPELYEVLDDIVGEGNGPQINTRRLGHWLKRHKDRIVDGFKLVQVPGTNMASWQVLKVSEGQA